MPKFERHFEVDPEGNTEEIKKEIDEETGRPKTELKKRLDELGVKVPSKEERKKRFEEKYGKTND